MTVSRGNQAEKVKCTCVAVERVEMLHAVLLGVVRDSLHDVVVQSGDVFDALLI